MKLSTVFVVFLAALGLPRISFSFGANNCSESEFSCDDGQQCVLKTKWCDSVEDCRDDSDEEYCHFSSYISKDPNLCHGQKFICGDGPCIPFSGRCDGVPSCSDNSDEDGCDNSTEDSTTLLNAMGNYTSENLSESRVHRQNLTTTLRHTSRRNTSPKVTTPVFESNQTTSTLTTIATTNVTMENIVPVLPLQDYPVLKSAVIRYPITEDQEIARVKAEAWLLGQRDTDQDLARKIVALHLSNETYFLTDSLESTRISQQLELQISVDLIRNSTKPMSLSDLALYVNALLASCHNPHNFHGVDLARILRLRTDSAIMSEEFVSPAVYMTLCILRKGSYHDIDKLRELFVTDDKQMLRLDIQALAVLAASCYSKVPNFSSINVKLYGAPNLMVASLTNSNYTDVYTTALLIQAFAAAGVTSKDWRRAEALDFLLSSQNPDGSFGDVLATYYAMPSLSGNDLESLKNPCYATDERSENSKDFRSTERESFVLVSLAFGNPVESVLTLQLKVEENAGFLDVLRIAENANPLFRMKYDQRTAVPAVYSVGDIPNDAERGMFWNLYIAERKYLIVDEKILTTLTPFIEDKTSLALKNGSHIIFWFKKVLS